MKAAQILAKIMGAAVDAGLIATSPCERVPLPKIEREETRFLTPEEVAVLADSIDHRYRAAVLVAAYAGLRAGELFGLRLPAWTSFADGSRSPRSWSRFVGRSFRPPKTRAGRRSVPIPAFVAGALNEHLIEAGVGPDGHVFTAPRGGPVRLAQWRRRFWLPALREADLAPLRCTISDTPRSPSGSPPAPRLPRSPPAPATRRWSPCWTATGICCMVRRTR